MNTQFEPANLFRCVLNAVELIETPCTPGLAVHIFDDKELTKKAIDAADIANIAILDVIYPGFKEALSR